MKFQPHVVVAGKRAWPAGIGPRVAHRWLAAAALLLLSACAGLLPPTQVPVQVAAGWQAPLPHQGAVQSLSDWWQRQGDPLQVELIAAAQRVSPSVAQAVARMTLVRANQAAARAALLPGISAQASASRGISQPEVPLATPLQGGLVASWELDLVGANQAVSQAAQAQVQSSQAQWHDARVAVAAEVAGLYASHRNCTGQLDLARREAASQQHTARLTALSAQAGFVAPALAALARASAAEANSRLSRQQAACDLDLKALVALTGIDEPDLGQKLAVAPVLIGQTAIFSIASVPLQTLSQRPDVFAAERDVVLASAQVGSALAQRWPRLSLSGAIGGLRLSGSGSGATDLSTWSFGPLALSVPLFDAGQRAAQVEAARAAYAAAVVTYQGRVRQAVGEVEQALVTLHSAEARRTDAQVAAQGYAQSLAATQSRFDQGLASRLELEEARRYALVADSVVLALKLAQRLAWVALYRAAGGGFEPDKLDVQAQVSG